MGKLKDIYPIAIELTKQNVNRHINRYLEVKEELPDFERYIADMHTYISEVWLDIWLNKASNKISKKEKKLFLHEHGIRTTGIDHKRQQRRWRNRII